MKKFGSYEMCGFHGVSTLTTMDKSLHHDKVWQDGCPVNGTNIGISYE
jgi:hypothetical protein